MASLFGITVIVDRSLDDDAFQFSGDKLILSPAKFAELKIRLSEKVRGKSADAAKEFFKELYGASGDQDPIPVKIEYRGKDPKGLNRRIKA